MVTHISHNLPVIMQAEAWATLTAPGKVFIFTETFELVSVEFCPLRQFRDAALDQRVLWMTDEAIYGSARVLKEIQAQRPELAQHKLVTLNEDDFQLLFSRIHQIYRQSIKSKTSSKNPLPLKPIAIERKQDSSTMQRISFPHQTKLLKRLQEQAFHQEHVRIERRQEKLRLHVKEIVRWLKKEGERFEWMKFLGHVGVHKREIKKDDRHSTIRPGKI